MYTFELTIPVKPGVDPAQLDEYSGNLLHALRQNGQILEKVYPAALKDGRLSYFVLCPETDALDEKYHNRYVKHWWQQAEASAETSLELKLLGEDPAGGSCGCSEPAFYILFAHYALIASPLRCGACFEPVPLYRLPKTYNESYNDVLGWETNYMAYDQLFMNGVGERFALRQLSDVNSELSVQGLEVCRRIETLSGKSVFYYLFNYRKVSAKQDRSRKCPSCGGDWLLAGRLHEKFDFKCEPCRLLSFLSCRS